MSETFTIEDIDKCIDLDSCIKWVIDLHEHEPGFTELMDQSEKDFVASSHHGFGTWLRNTLKMWDSGPANEWFGSKGIYHPDDMSAIILTSTYRNLNKKPIKLDAQIKKHRDFWERNDPRINTGLEWLDTKK